jgi:hypothetical protein
MRYSKILCLTACIGVFVCTLDVAAQRRAESARSAQLDAPVDLTGYWVSVISEDWAWRMRTPPRGDYASVPLNAAGRAEADRWSDAQDGSCLAFGAAAALRMPTRVHITWRDANTLQVETDNGLQTRLLRFGPDQRPSDSVRTLQGFSTAHWEVVSSVTGSGADGGIVTSSVAVPRWASLQVETTDLQAAWLRPNGVPYSSDAVLTEYFDRFADGEDEWFTVTTIVEDPTYLTEPFVISSNFKRERNGAKWDPADCEPTE